MEKQGKYLDSFQRKMLEKNLNKQDLRKGYQCRIKIMLLADEGLTHLEIREILKCSPETIRYWTAQAKAGQTHSWSDCRRGRKTNPKYKARLEELVMSSPRDYGYPFKRWTGHWLSKHLNQELGIRLSPRHVNRLLKQMGVSTKAKSSTNNSLIENSGSESSNIKLRQLSPVSRSVSTQQWLPNFLN